MGIVSLVFLIAAAVLFGLAAIGIPATSRINLIGAGLFSALVGYLLERLP